MTPFHRTLPFQLAWNIQAGPGEGEGGHTAHAVRISRQHQAGQDAGHAQLTAGQMIKVLSSISNRVKQGTSKEVKWGFL